MKEKELINIAEMVEFIGSRKALRIEKWRNETDNNWRCGIEWYGPHDFEYVCEKKKLQDALSMCVDYLNRKQK